MTPQPYPLEMGGEFAVCGARRLRWAWARNNPLRIVIPLGLIALLAVVAACAPAHGQSGSEPIQLKRLLPADQDWLIDGALDFRYRDANTGSTHQAYIQNAEIDLQHSISYHHYREGTVFLQVIDENPPDSPSGSSGVRLGEAYATYRIPILTESDSTAYFKAGQFIIPFGLLPVYDTHLQILQTLYPESLGERIDWGVGVDGRFNGIIDYRFAVTAGSGPNNPDLNSNRVIALRLGRLIASPYGTFNVGGSMLSGRLPITEVNPETDFAPSLPPSGRVISPIGFVDKTRIAGDGQWNYGNTTARGEAVAGADSDQSVYGYYLEGDYRFAAGFTGVLSRAFWDYGVGDSTSTDTAAGVNVSYGNDLVIRTLYEDRRDFPNANLMPVTSEHNRYLFTVQILTRF